VGADASDIEIFNPRREEANRQYMHMPKSMYWEKKTDSINPEVPPNQSTRQARLSRLGVWRPSCEAVPRTVGSSGTGTRHLLFAATSLPY
jgi:hypothetical protein